MGYSIAEFLNMEEVKNTLKFSKRYHQKVYFPEWFDNNFISFKTQVMDMASPKKPLKASDTFKILSKGLINQKSNILEFSTPYDSDYIKDIRKNNGRFKVKKPDKKELEIFYELE